MTRNLFFRLFLISTVFTFVFFSCQSRNDPFSAKNDAPSIAIFEFKPDPNLPLISDDSLKFKQGESYLLHLEYSDPEFSTEEGKTLQATFSFISGGGSISHDQFIQSADDSLMFTSIPAEFNGDLLFTPNTSGIVRLQLVVSDGVKGTDPVTTTAIFFENLAPRPSFTSQVLTQVNPYRVSFDPSESVDRDGEIDRLIWTFGDGSEPDTVLDKSSIIHEFKESGQFRVRLRIIDDEGKADSTEQVITTNNQPPIAALRLTPQEGAAPLRVEYNAGGSVDPDGEVTSFLLSFDDGFTANDSSGFHTFNQDGVYDVLLTVRDNLGLAASTTRSVTVSTPPVASLAITPKEGAFPLEVTLDASGSNDPFGGEIIYEIFIDDQLRYTQSRVEHLFDTPKTTAYQVRLEVESRRTGLRSVANESVLVTNTPPVADFTFSPGNPQPTVEILFTSTSSDPDSTDRITNYTWIWGDGEQNSGANLSSIRHKYNISGTYSVKLIVQDRFNGISEVTKEVTVQ